VEDFILSEEIIRKIAMANSSTIEYYYTRYSSSTHTCDMIKDIIKESFYNELEWKDIDELINIINNYDNFEYIDWLVDIYYSDFIKSMNYFDMNTPIIEWDETITDIIRRAQFEWYSELFEDIRKEFIEYLKWLDS